MHLIEFAMNYSQHPNGEIFALDFLSNIIDDFYNENFIIALANKLVNFHRHLTIFNAMDRILNTHYQRLSEDLWMCIVQSTLARLDDEVEANRLASVKNSFHMSRCLHLLLRVIVQLYKANVSGNSPVINYSRIKGQVWKVSAFLKEAPLF